MTFLEKWYLGAFQSESGFATLLVDKKGGIIVIYITGDTHGQFQHIADFCSKTGTQKSDIMIILGDVGLNFTGGFIDRFQKKAVNDFPMTTFCIHGNHENRPSNIETYHTQKWHGGTVYVEDEYPDLLFAQDGEIFDMDGYSCLTIGGAYSIDKLQRLTFGWPWWEDEQPTPEIMHKVEYALEERGWKVDVILSHTVPLQYEPREVFLPHVDQCKVDKSTEEWLESIEKKLKYRKWYAGHYHINKQVGKLQLLYKEIHSFSPDLQHSAAIPVYEDS